MSNKFIKRNPSTGRYEEEAGVVTQIADSLVSTDGTGRIPETLMPVGIGADTKTFTASEGLSAGDLVNLWDDSGTIKARKADASTTGKEAVGFVQDAVLADGEATVYFEGVITGLSGLTIAARQYLSASSAGQVTETPVTGTGKVHQYIGKAVSTTEIAFEATDVTVLA